MLKELMLCGLLTLSPVKMANNDIKQPNTRMALHDELTWDEYQRTLENRWNLNVNNDFTLTSQGSTITGAVADSLSSSQINEIWLYYNIDYAYNFQYNIIRLTHTTEFANYTTQYEDNLNYFNEELGDDYFYFELDYFIYLVNEVGAEFVFLEDYTYILTFYNDLELQFFSSNQLSQGIKLDFSVLLDISYIIQYYMQYQFDGLENEYDNLQEIYNELVNNTIILEQDYERLQTDFEELTTQYNELLRDYNSLEIGNAELLQQIRDLNTEISLLNDYIAVLEMQIDGVFENVFEWFEDTFDAFARVLDYEILPNIKIAYLFALPIIAAAIYFVVKVTIA